MSILFCKFLHENKVYRKNGVHHDEASGKSFETVISDFLFLKLCYGHFSPQSNVKNHNFIKKLVQFSIFSRDPSVYLIKSTKSKARAWTNKKRPMHFGASLSSGEVLEWKRFYDKSIIGMYLLVLSSHMHKFCACFWQKLFESDIFSLNIFFLGQKFFYQSFYPNILDPKFFE